MHHHCGFDELAELSGVLRLAKSREVEADIALPGIVISDVPDDLFILEGAILAARPGLVWRDRWICSAIHYMPENWRQVSWLPGVLARDADSIELHPGSFDACEHVCEPAMFVDCLMGGRNFAHTVQDTLPYGLLFRRARALIPGLRPVITPFSYENQRQLFSIVFDYPYDQCIFVNRPTKFDQLVVARRQTVFNLSEGADLGKWKTSFAGLKQAREVLFKALEIAPIIPEELNERKVCFYLHRIVEYSGDSLRTLQGRNFVNQHQLLDAVMNIGFSVMEPGRTNLRTLSKLLPETGAIVGIHGAQLANMIFCRPKTKVFEIRSFSGVWRCFEAIAAVLGLEFSTLNQVRPADVDAPELDVAGIVARLKPLNV